MYERALGPGDGVYLGDGEWMSWDEFSRHADEQSRRTEFPDADPQIVEVFKNLLAMAEQYFGLTGRHLNVYGDIGELYAQIAFGLELHRNHAQGSDGRLGNDFVEVKTITPFKTTDTVELNLDRHFSKVLVVKIDDDFAVSARMIERKSFPKTTGRKLRLDFNQF